MAALLASIVPNMVEHMTLASTAWIGATAFMLGVDCFTRAGLKEVRLVEVGGTNDADELVLHLQPRVPQLVPQARGREIPLDPNNDYRVGYLGCSCVSKC